MSIQIWKPEADDVVKLATGEEVKLIDHPDTCLDVESEKWQVAVAVEDKIMVIWVESDRYGNWSETLL